MIGSDKTLALRRVRTAMTIRLDAQDGRGAAFRRRDVDPVTGRAVGIRRYTRTFEVCYDVAHAIVRAVFALWRTQAQAFTR